MKLTPSQHFAQSQRIAREIIARLNVRLEQEKRLRVSAENKLAYLRSKLK